MIRVLRLQELSVKQMQSDAFGDKQIRMYLPDFNEGRQVSRDFLFNVSLSFTLLNLFSFNFDGPTSAKKALCQRESTTPPRLSRILDSP